jgi:hypothetical protein
MVEALCYKLEGRGFPLLFYQVAPQLYSRGRVDPETQYFSENLIASGIEPGPLDLWPETQ